MLQGFHGIMEVFNRVTFLVDENVHAVNFLVSALLMLLDRAGSLYAELARFIFRMLGLQVPPKFQPMPPPPAGVPGALAAPASPAAPAAAAPGANDFDAAWTP